MAIFTVHRHCTIWPSVTQRGPGTLSKTGQASQTTDQHYFLDWMENIFKRHLRTLLPVLFCQALALALARRLSLFVTLRLVYTDTQVNLKRWEFS